jgi:hypothetical protein
MTEQHWPPANFQSSEWVAVLQEKYNSISFPLDTPAESKFLKSPPAPLPQTDRSPPDRQTNKKRQEFDHLSSRITGTGLIGADLAAGYIREKYRNNNSIATVKQASYVALSFLHFLNKTGTNLYKVNRQDICAFVEHEQDRGLKANSVISNLRSVYTRAMCMLVEHCEKNPDCITEEELLDFFIHRQEVSGWTLAQSKTLHTRKSPMRRGTREVSRMPERLSGRFMKAQAARWT